LTAFLGKYGSNDIATITKKSASTHCQQFLFFAVRTLESDLFVDIHNQTIDWIQWQMSEQQGSRPILTMSVNQVSTIFGLVFWVIHAVLDCRHL
jgi:hypothetical protein